MIFLIYIFPINSNLNIIFEIKILASHYFEHMEGFFKGKGPFERVDQNIMKIIEKKNTSC